MNVLPLPKMPNNHRLKSDGRPPAQAITESGDFRMSPHRPAFLDPYIVRDGRLSEPGYVCGVRDCKDRGALAGRVPTPEFKVPNAVSVKPGPQLLSQHTAQ